MNGESVPVRELAGLATALLWSFSALAWSIAGRRVGSVPVVAIRITLAAIILTAAHAVAFGPPWPAGLAGETLVLLAVSGILGACIGDIFLFRGLVLIGPRLGMLILALTPVVSAVLAYFSPMREGLGPRAIAGIALTVGGVAWVLAEPQRRRAWPTTRPAFRRGVAMCLASVVAAAAGYVISRMAMQAGPRWFTAGPPLPGVDPFSGALVRVVAATASTWLALSLIGGLGPVLEVRRDRRAMLIILAGTIVGPVVGIWMSMIALAGVQAGVAVTLINTSPIMMIPIAYAVYREKPSARAMIGTAIAVGGIFLLMWK